MTSIAEGKAITQETQAIVAICWNSSITRRALAYNTKGPVLHTFAPGIGIRLFAFHIKAITCAPHEAIGIRTTRTHVGLFMQALSLVTNIGCAKSSVITILAQRAIQTTLRHLCPLQTLFFLFIPAFIANTTSLGCIFIVGSNAQLIHAAITDGTWLVIIALHALCLPHAENGFFFFTGNTSSLFTNMMRDHCTTRSGSVTKAMNANARCHAFFNCILAGGPMRHVFKCAHVFYGIA